MKRKQDTETFERTLTIERKADHGINLYQASLSSEYPVERWGYTEVLEHSDTAINMERAKNGLVMLFNHNPDEPIGRVNDISVRSDKKLVGNLVFSKTDAGKLRQSQVDEGTLTDISIRYSVDDYRESEDDAGRITRTVTRFTPQEASVVSVPADPSVGIGRNQPAKEEKPMSKENDNTPNGEEKRGGGDVVVEFESGLKAGLQQGARVERERVAAIDALFDAPGFRGTSYDGLRKTLIDNGSTVDQARDALLSMVGRDPEQARPITDSKSSDTQQRTHRVEGGADQSEKTREAMFKATEFRAGLYDKEKAAEAHRELHENPYGGWSLSEIARACLNDAGADTRGMSAYDVVGYALNPQALPDSKRHGFVGQGTSNFAGLVESISNKSLMQGFQESDETWRSIVRIGSVSSFRQESRVELSEFTDLATVKENGEYKHGDMTDNREYITAAKYGKLYALTREMLINDDLNALTRLPAEMGRAADRKIGDLVYAVLTTPSTLRDGTAIFDATRSNIITSGAAPSIAQLDAMRKLMALQSGLNSAAHGQNIRLTRLIVPVALEMTARILATSTVDPDQKTAESGGGGTRPNPFSGTFEVIADPRLDAASSVIYYGSADPSLYDTIEVAFLNGNQMPMLESREGWTVDGTEYKVRLEVGVAPLGYKGLVRNAGA